MMGFGMMGALGCIGLLLSVAIVVGFVVLVVWAVRRFSGQGNVHPSSQSAGDVLQVRYARGEITRDQYQQMLKDLS